MNKDMLIRIFASTSKGDNKGAIATGYPVAKDLILTARHTLYDKQGKLFPNIEIKWHYLHQEKGDAYDWKDATLFECGLDKKWDVVLLHCPFPERIDYRCRLQAFNPREELNWESSGFSDAGKGGNKMPTALGGTVYLAADGDDLLELKENTGAETESSWSGISGSPLFIAGSHRIAGVILEIPTDFKAKRIYATPTWKILENPQFLKAITLDSTHREESLKRVHRHLLKQLKNNADVYDDLAEDLNINDDELSDENRYPALIDKLLTLTVNQLITHFNTVLEQMYDDDELKKATFIRDKFLYYIIPIVFDQQIIQQVCEASQSFVCALDIGTKTVAEIVMAGKDGRSIRFREGSGQKAPEGQWLIDIPPECGLDKNDFIKTFEEQMIKNHAGLDDLAAGASSTLDHRGAVKLASANLGDYEDEGQTRYYFYTLPQEEREKESQINKIKILKDRLAGITFIQCQLNVVTTIRERKEINRTLTKIHFPQQGDL